MKEEQANRFASAFLMPAESFADDFAAAGSTLEGLFDLKEHWGCSISAMTFRARQLDLLSIAEYRERYRMLSRRGWRLQEPQEPLAEEPQLFRVAMEAFHLKTGKTLFDLAHELHVSPHMLSQVTGVKVDSAEKANTTGMTSISEYRLKRHLQ